MGRQSNKTFVTAGGSGMALISAAVASASTASTWQGFVAAGFFFAAGVFLVGVGLYARDDDVSDEGGVALKDQTFEHPPPARAPLPAAAAAAAPQATTQAGDAIPVVTLPVTLLPEEPAP